MASQLPQGANAERTLSHGEKEQLWVMVQASSGEDPCAPVTHSLLTRLSRAAVDSVDTLKHRHYHHQIRASNNLKSRGCKCAGDNPYHRRPWNLSAHSNTPTRVPTARHELQIRAYRYLIHPVFFASTLVHTLYRRSETFHLGVTIRGLQSEG